MSEKTTFYIEVVSWLGCVYFVYAGINTSMGMLNYIAKVFAYAGPLIILWRGKRVFFDSDSADKS